MAEEMQNRCRACLSESDCMLSLFDEYEHGLTLATILESLIAVKISKDDGLPSMLCDSCSVIVTQFYNFTVVYEDSEKRLYSLLSENNQEYVLLDVKDIKSPPTSPTEHEDLNDETTYVENAENSTEIKYLPEKTYITEENTENNETFVNSVENDKDNTEETKETSDDSLEHKQNNDERLVLNFSEETECYEIMNTQKAENFMSELPSICLSGIDRSHETVVKYECNICGEAHLFAASFQQHMRLKHDLSDIDCEKYASKIHVKIRQKPELSTPPETRVIPFETHQCGVCKRDFHFASQLQHHMKIHNAIRKYICEVCGARFIRKTYLEDHREGHNTEKNHVCKFCGKAFKRRTVLRAHKRVHTHPNHYVCELCGRGFTNSSTLKTHKLLIHVKSRNFKCVICNLTFPLKSTLNKHLLRHQKRERGEKGFNCSQCDMQYKDKSSLKRHVESKHEGLIQLVSCSDCPKKYTSKTNLMKHIRKHHSYNNIEEIVVQFENVIEVEERQ